MAKIDIYTAELCNYCSQAKALLTEKNAEYRELRVDSNDRLRFQMSKRANGEYTLPQIFINDEHIGGYDELYALDKEGLLDKKLTP